MSLEIKIKKHSDVSIPTRQTDGAAGFDLEASHDEVLLSGEIRLIDAGFSMEIPKGYFVLVRPRSGLASKFGINISSSGVIDSDYRGKMMIPLINLGDKTFKVEKGMRVAQMLILPVPDIKLTETEELSSTERGEGGFGHTGLK